MTRERPRRDRDLDDSIEQWQVLVELDSPPALLRLYRGSLAMAYTGRAIDLHADSMGGAAPPPAEIAVHEALALWQQVPEPMRGREVRTLIELSTVHARRHETDEAIAALIRAVELGEAQLAAEHERRTTAWHLGMALRCLAGLLSERDTARAMASYRRAVEVLSEDVAEYGGPRFELELSSSKRGLGNLLLRSGERDEGIELLKQGEQAMARLADRFPENLHYAATFAEVRTEQANRAMRSQAGREEVELAFEDALGRLREVVARAPHAARYRSYLGATLNNLAMCELDRWGEPGRACRHLREALAQQSLASKSSPGNARYRAYLANHHSLMRRCMRVLADHVELADAAGWYAARFDEDRDVQVFAVQALCRSVELAREDEALSPERREVLARAHGDGAVTVLRAMLESGATSAASLRRPSLFGQLRDLPSFRALLEDL